jgi:hypothetical protein
MSKLTEYAAESRFSSGDILIKDGTGGTKKITAADAAREFAGLVSSNNHRMVWGGKKIGTAVTTEQATAIKNGTFDDLFVGDYWTINSINWRIWDMDYFLNCGDTSFSSHHLVIVPDSVLYSAKMNDTNTTEGGYVGSKMYTENLEQAKNTIKSAFGDMVLTHRDYLTNAVTDGHASAGAWFDSTVELMNEIMVYGTHVHTPANNGVVIPTNYTTGKQQFAAAMLNPSIVNKRSTFWLRDVVSASGFAYVGGYGTAICTGATYSLGVRPYFVIG